MFDPAEVHDVLDRFNDIIKLGTNIVSELEKESKDTDLKVLNTLGK
ncbi:hypothetical protein ABNX05_11565 [Lysinibacillus sp. M3]|uniref:Uncharacterized protein n=1 Tax=Lysinibacillus zambalensis TaxID=3160866 RepID=A0ABV1MRX6_9BACI